MREANGIIVGNSRTSIRWTLLVLGLGLLIAGRFACREEEGDRFDDTPHEWDNGMHKGPGVL